MKTDLKSIESKEDAATAASRMLRERIGSLIVNNENDFSGIISKWDFVEFIAKN